MIIFHKIFIKTTCSTETIKEIEENLQPHKPEEFFFEFLHDKSKNKDEQCIKKFEEDFSHYIFNEINLLNSNIDIGLESILLCFFRKNDLDLNLESTWLWFLPWSYQNENDPYYKNNDPCYNLYKKNINQEIKLFHTNVLREMYNKFLEDSYFDRNKKKETTIINKNQKQESLLNIFIALIFFDTVCKIDKNGRLLGLLRFNPVFCITLNKIENMQNGKIKDTLKQWNKVFDILTQALDLQAKNLEKNKELIPELFDKTEQIKQINERINKERGYYDTMIDSLIKMLECKLTRYPEAESIINTFFNNPNNHTKLNFKKLNNSQEQYKKSEFIDQNEEILQDITKEITEQISQKNLEINNRVHLFIQLQVLNKAYDSKPVDKNKTNDQVDKNKTNDQSYNTMPVYVITTISCVFLIIIIKK